MNCKTHWNASIEENQHGNFHHRVDYFARGHCIIWMVRRVDRKKSWYTQVAWGYYWRRNISSHILSDARTVSFTPERIYCCVDKAILRKNTGIKKEKASSLTSRANNLAHIQSAGHETQGKARRSRLGAGRLAAMAGNRRGDSAGVSGGIDMTLDM